MSEIFTAYFAERERTGGRFLADAVLELFGRREVPTSVMLRGIASFGSTNILRTDRTLTLSEDPPVAIVAVDTPERIGALAQDVAAMTGVGLLCRERSGAMPTDGDVRVTFYLHHRVHVTVCDVLHRLGFSSAEVFLGVDGTVAGTRRRGKFFSRNLSVPLMVSGVGTAAQAAAAVDTFPHIPATVHPVQVCKRQGQRLATPPSDAAFAKLVVRTAEDARHDGRPIHRALVGALKDAGGSGATALRGVWGFHDGSRPHGDRFFQLSRHVPVHTMIIDTQERIAAAFPIVDALTADIGLVTCEPVAAVLARHGEQSRGSLHTD
ncbi:hypothetical protein BVC93_00890 [Mycobacterium sp. MS1601]|uniref:DUF190 domain-containing protein n=1 Tax=Mycobacterium sp. MS1601 TaxID=1936029 RepID=UPI0009797F4A|nr:DUF190 domain-containing protein [Mycobacterium sp. MS1601]AQA01214.1 hypothetical protein BVC93_00890 [Mycobacterium sp. MS1601]